MQTPRITFSRYADLSRHRCLGRYYNIDYRPLPGLPRHFDLWWQMPIDPVDPPPGVYAISVTNLWELPLRPEEKTRPAWFRQRPPDDRIGYSILLYRVE